MGELSIIGIWGILRHLPRLWGRIGFTVKTIKALKPDVVVTIDAQEFSFRVMKHLLKLNQRSRLMHYVAPTVWAWRPGRVRKISKFLDLLLCLYPFEPPYFEKHGLKTKFVRHPVAAEQVLPEKKRDPNLLCVLSGSRKSEVEILLPTFKQTIELLKKVDPDLHIAILTLTR